MTTDSTANVVPFTQALAWHSAATHVLGLALQRASQRALISANNARSLLDHAQNGMDTAEVRQLIHVVLERTTGAPVAHLEHIP